MKKFILIIIALIGIPFYLVAQSAGDYRSVVSGNWNDPTKWEIFDGGAWISSTTYPGENPGTGSVTIMHETEIKITETVPNEVANLFVSANYPGQIVNYDCEVPFILPSGVLIFSAENSIALNVSGDVDIIGYIKISNENGVNTHKLLIGHNLRVGAEVEVLNCYSYVVLGDLQTINLDDKLGITFNTTDPNSSITRVNGITFHDVTFNGTGINVSNHISITGNANFINGIVKPGGFGSAITFLDGATVSGGSNLSFIDGPVHKYGDDPFTFPIGNAGVFAPLGISTPASQESFWAYYERNSNGFTGIITDPGLLSISSCERWVLSNERNDPFTYPFDVTVGWTSANRCGLLSTITSVPDVTLAQFNGISNSNSWDGHGGVGVGAVGNGTVTYHGVKRVGTFTLGNVGTGCGTPFGLTTTNISTNSATVSWSAVAGSLNYDVEYRPQYAVSWIDAATATTSTSVNLAGLSASGIYEWRVKATCSSVSSSYRQAQFQTINVCGTPTGLSTSNITTSSAQLSWNAVSNAINYQLQYKLTTAATWTAVATGINVNFYTLNGLAIFTSYNWRVLANCTGPTQGGYAQSSFTTLPAPPPFVCNDVYETNNTSSQAKTISLGNTISAGISSANDIDWFKVTTPSNSNTNLDVRLSNLPADYNLYVYDKSLKLVGSSASTGTSNEVVIYHSNARKATYYIRVEGKNGAYSTSQCYQLLAAVSASAGLISNRTSDGSKIMDDQHTQLLYPNPASAFLSLSFSSVQAGSADIKILNTAGQLIKLYPVRFTKGHNQLSIPVNEIKEGIYFARFQHGELIMVRKFVIAR